MRSVLCHGRVELGDPHQDVAGKVGRVHVERPVIPIRRIRSEGRPGWPDFEVDHVTVL